ncbi:hypothetical protein NPIL_493161, partial [Nephila pilipes]
KIVLVEKKGGWKRGQKKKKNKAVKKREEIRERFNVFLLDLSTVSNAWFEREEEEVVLRVRASTAKASALPDYPATCYRLLHPFP